MSIIIICLIKLFHSILIRLKENSTTCQRSFLYNLCISKIFHCKFSREGVKTVCGNEIKNFRTFCSHTCSRVCRTLNFDDEPKFHPPAFSTKVVSFHFNIQYIFIDKKKLFSRENSTQTYFQTER